MDMKEALRIKKKADAALIGPGDGYKAGLVFPIASRDDMDPDELSTDIRQGEVSPGQKWAMPGILAEMGNDQIKAAQMMRGERAMDPLGVGMAALDLSSPGLLTNMMRKPTGKAILNANVWQGGPHKYGREGAAESLQHIGKGEGATAYGWGRYDAQAEDVAKEYVRTTSLREFDGKPLTQAVSPEEKRAAYLFGSYKTTDDAMAAQKDNIRRYEAEGNPEIVADEKKILAEMEALLPRVSDPNGHLYKHDLPDEDIARYMDWDKPLSEQPESVRAALEGKVNAWNIKGPNGEDTYWTGRGFKTQDEAEKAVSDFGPGYHVVREDATGGDIYNTLRNNDTAEAASKFMQDAGVPGLQYYDGMSRYTPQQIDPIKRQIAHWERVLKEHDDPILLESARKHLIEEQASLDKMTKNVTRNYVTWDQDVLDRMKMLERNGEQFNVGGTPELAMLANTMRGGEPDLADEPAPVDLNQYGWNKAFFDQKIQAEAAAEAERKRQGMREALQQGMQRGLAGGVI